MNLEPEEQVLGALPEPVSAARTLPAQYQRSSEEEPQPKRKRFPEMKDSFLGL